MNTRFALLACACLSALVPVAANAQDYYGRQNLVPRVAPVTDQRGTWQAGGWTDWSSTCSSSATKTRAVTCKRADSATVEDVFCSASGAKPTATDTSEIFTGCSFSATNWSEYVAAPQCSATAIATSTAQCLRSDGTVVDDAICATKNVTLTRTKQVPDFKSCSFGWVAGNWSTASSACTDTAAYTRAVTCQRSDGTVTTDDKCVAGTRPDASKIEPNLASCSFTAIEGTPVWESTCSVSSTWTATGTCKRSDGKIVAASECTSRGIAVVTTGSGSNYSGCAVEWATSPWSTWSSTCSSTASRTRSVNCILMTPTVTKPTVAESQCLANAPRPDASETQVDYSGCSYSAGNWTKSSAAACSASTTITETAQCLRSDGSAALATDCTSRGIALSRTSTGADYSACTYAVTVNTVSWSSTCSATATKTTTYVCKRSDGTVVPSSPSTCTDLSVKTTTSVESNMTGCVEGLVNGGFEAGGLSSWDNTGSPPVVTGAAHSGTYSVKMNPDNQLRQNMMTTAGKVYTISYWVYARHRSASLGDFMNSYGPQGKIVENRALGGTAWNWYQVSGTFVGTGGTVQIGFYYYAPGGDVAYLDDIVIQ